MFSKRFYSSSSKMISQIKNQNLIKTKGFINGQWVSSSSNESFVVTNPALVPKNEAVIETVQSMTEDDYNKAIDYAYDSFEKFKKTTGRYRSGLLLRLYELMIENQEDLAKLCVLENGKPYADALGEVKYAASFFQWFSEEAPRINGDIIPSANPQNRILVLKQPIGVCGILTPWNFPLAMITRKVGAAIATGCTTVIKPASETPLSALAIAYLAQEAGFPEGTINVLPCKSSSMAGKLICEHPKIKKVSFTGSTGVGSILMKQSSSTLKKLSMELGGNAPFIVFDDVKDIDKAVQGAIASKFRSSGQTCVCANRLFIHESIYDDFKDKLISKLKETVVLGDGLKEGVTYGPVINERSMKKVREHIEDATGKGAKILFGGNKREDLGANFHDLTVLGDVTTEMQIFNDETFGPVAPLIKFKSDDEVIKMANDTQFGLAGYFYATDVSRVFKVAEAINVGMLGINTGAITEAALPFGGIGESGFGREGSKFGVDDYLIIKSCVLGSVDV
ncbi:unnamed protein product [Candida verbasci]|uniref:Succinate-semialdehyde dehydrogenase n=1 Tax=Candida verbasci TaxID=1227364 RepID=A0A9W4TWA5_9ASCO|nr:unnamed protein product [Candida verbasci]